eukprot:9075621-Ditylum_brightwellii.AAC.1
MSKLVFLSLPDTLDPPYDDFDLDEMKDWCDSLPSTSSCTPFQLNLKTDRFGDETSVSLVDLNGVVLLEYEEGSLNSEQSYTWEQCLPDSSCYTFAIKDSADDDSIFFIDDIPIDDIFGDDVFLAARDSYGDGICCDAGEGSYTIYYDDIEVAAGGDFGGSATHIFGK